MSMMLKVFIIDPIQSKILGAKSDATHIRIHLSLLILFALERRICHLIEVYSLER